MKIKSTLIVCLLTAWLPACALASEPRPEEPQYGPVDLSALKVLDLATAERVALSDSPTLEAARERVASAHQQTLVAKAAYWPFLSLTASGTHVRMSERNRESALATVRAFDPSAGIDDPEDYYTLDLVAGWTLFDGFLRKFELARARFGFGRGEAGYHEAARLLLSAVAANFHLAQLAREEMAIASADQEFNQRQVEEARIRLRVGTGALSDVLNFEVLENAAQAEYFNAQRSYHLARVTLAELMGVPQARLPKNLDLEPLGRDEPPAAISPEQVDQELEFALVHRPDLSGSEIAVKEAEARVGSARAPFYPSMQVVGVLMDGERPNDLALSQGDFGSSIGLTLSYPLFSGGADSARLRQAKHLLEASREDSRLKRLKVAADVSQAAVRLEVARRQFELQRENEDLVRRNRDLVETEYRAGQASLVRLNEAQRNLTAAQARLALARVSLRNASYNVDVATGRVIERHILR